ncbi:hypothetical protein K490DRAFT_68921 [Saccharata proteae CBS 121410]|uniref:Uncharacterized protein n=1 Tax=Saccharata proteae CBS 121410 TaxID=1314787 RepID=A0A9P4HPI9_9PEZI|nr:hypothetical protein K490DRAFT_68921 [Saccharata proteae CBS 121410]
MPPRDADALFRFLDGQGQECGQVEWVDMTGEDCIVNAEEDLWVTLDEKNNLVLRTRSDSFVAPKQLEEYFQISREKLTQWVWKRSRCLRAITIAYGMGVLSENEIRLIKSNVHYIRPTLSYLKDLGWLGPEDEMTSSEAGRQPVAFKGGSLSRAQETLRILREHSSNHHTIIPEAVARAVSLFETYKAWNPAKFAEKRNQIAWIRFFCAKNVTTEGHLECFVWGKKTNSDPFGKEALKEFDIEWKPPYETMSQIGFNGSGDIRFRELMLLSRISTLVFSPPASSPTTFQCDQDIFGRPLDVYHITVVPKSDSLEHAYANAGPLVHAANFVDICKRFYHQNEMPWMPLGDSTCPSRTFEYCSNETMIRRYWNLVEKCKGYARHPAVVVLLQSAHRCAETHSLAKMSKIEKVINDAIENSELDLEKPVPATEIEKKRKRDSEMNDEGSTKIGSSDMQVDDQPENIKRVNRSEDDGR